MWVIRSLSNLFNKFSARCAATYWHIIDVLTTVMHTWLVIEILERLNKCERSMIAESLPNIIYMRYLFHHNHINFFFIFFFFFDSHTCINHKCSLSTFKFFLFYISLPFHTSVRKVSNFDHIIMTAESTCSKQENDRNIWIIEKLLLIDQCTWTANLCVKSITNLYTLLLNE